MDEGVDMKSQRQAKIMEIISNRNVETQEQLLAELQSAGFRSTQVLYKAVQNLEKK